MFYLIKYKLKNEDKIHYIPVGNFEKIELPDDTIIEKLYCSFTPFGSIDKDYKFCYINLRNYFTTRLTLGNLVFEEVFLYGFDTTLKYIDLMHSTYFREFYIRPTQGLENYFSIIKLHIYANKIYTIHESVQVSARSTIINIYKNNNLIKTYPREPETELWISKDDI